ncbi:MAG TPA: DUF4192 domain-containing protein [Nocardia sp.]|nr:DUF4192 domain-containing protein [Nocardia sp.]
MTTTPLDPAGDATPSAGSPVPGAGHESAPRLADSASRTAGAPHAAPAPEPGPVPDSGPAPSAEVPTPPDALRADTTVTEQSDAERVMPVSTTAPRRHRLPALLASGAGARGPRSAAMRRGICARPTVLSPRPPSPEREPERAQGNYDEFEDEEPPAARGDLDGGGLEGGGLDGGDPGGSAPSDGASSGRGDGHEEPAGPAVSDRAESREPWRAREPGAGESWPDPLPGVRLPPRVDITECAEAAPPYRVGGWSRRIRLDDAGQLLAALPAMIGFFPQRSLVIALIGPEAAREGVAEIHAVLRFDMEAARERMVEAVAGYARCVAGIASDQRDVLAVIIDDRLVVPGGATTIGLSAEWLVPRMIRRFRHEGLRVAGAWATPELAAGKPWWSLHGPSSRGRVTDPTASAVAMANVLDGRPILRSRTDLVAVLAPDEFLGAQVGEQITTLAAKARTGFIRALHAGDVLGYRRRCLEYVLLQVDATEAGEELEPQELAAVAVLLRERAVRDALFGLAANDRAAAAEQLWTQLTRACAGRDRADVATLTAYCAYVRGDGPLAGIAVEAALEADSTHAMALLLDTALRSGMRPAQMRRLARSGYDTAACLGVDLGPMTP